MTDDGYSTASLKRVLSTPHSGLADALIAMTSMICLTLILLAALKANATTFDITEKNVAGLMALVFGGREFIPVAFRRFTSKPKPVE